MKELDQSISFFIFPFTLENKDVQTHFDLDGFSMPKDSVWKELNMKIEKDVFFSHIQSFLQKSVTGDEGELNKKKSCDLLVYSIDDKEWGKHLGNNNTYVMEWKENGIKKEIQFYFPNRINYFESPKLLVYPDAFVGILIIPIELKKRDNDVLPPMQELMDFVYRLHKTEKNEKPTLKYPLEDIDLTLDSFAEQKRKSKFKAMKEFSKLLGIDNFDPQLGVPFSFDLPMLAQRLLSFIGHPYKFINPNRCHVCTYMHTKDDETLTADEKNDFLRISRCENSQYKILNKNDEFILDTFDNIHFAVNVEGGAIMVCGDTSFHHPTLFAHQYV